MSKWGICQGEMKIIYKKINLYISVTYKLVSAFNSLNKGFGQEIAEYYILWFVFNQFDAKISLIHQLSLD